MRVVVWLVFIAFFAYLLIGGIVGALNRRRRGDGPDAPANLDPLTRAWRRRRFSRGKGDNWLTRTHVRFDGSGQGPFVQFFPKRPDPNRPPRSTNTDDDDGPDPKR